MKTGGWFEGMAAMITAYGVRVLGVIAAVWASFMIAGWVQKRVTHALRARRFDETLSIFFGNVLRWVILIAAGLACLSLFGIETTSFAAILGAAGLAVGLAFQGTLSNFAAGVMLLVFRPFKVGDYVVAAGKEGVVNEIGLFVTLLDTLDNRQICVSNSSVVGGPIENYTVHPLRRVDVDVKVAGNEDLDATRKALEAAAFDVPGRDPKGAEVFLKGLGAGCTEWQVRVWAKPAAYWDVWQATVRSVAYELQRSNLNLPTPGMNVTVSGNLASKWDQEGTAAQPSTH